MYKDRPPTVAVIAVVLFVYFLGFNVLEASQPSLVSKLAPGQRKGAAVGAYNKTQAVSYTHFRAHEIGRN